MEQTNDEKLLSEMNGFISENSVSSGTDDDGLPFEPFDAFSTDPVEFGEMAERMLDKVENLFDLTRIYNRHSKKYLKAFGLLERGIRLLGSVCVTRTALKDHGQALPELGQLTTAKLYGMASFNYRKLDTALSERLAQGNDLYPELTDALFRCFTLLGRLSATERKIHKYFTDKYHDGEDYKPMIEGLAFSEKSWTKCYYPKNEEAPAFRSAPAYPVLKEELEVTAPKEERPTAEPPALPAPRDEEEAAAETGPDDAGPQQDHDPIFRDPAGDPPEPPPVRGSPAETGRPACYDILDRVLERRRQSGCGSLSFTCEEIELLAEDPEFEKIDPVMAEDMRRILREADS